ncbi:MAG: CvpA family protein [Clostridia bacterium]|nr:CvpA family protein [Clostridia bacterium]
MNFVIDLIVVAIIAVCAVVSAKRGFVKVLVEVVGFVAAIILTFTISTPLSEATYDKIIEPPIVNAAVEAVGESAEHEAWNAIPDFIVDNAAKLGLSVEDFSQKISENLSNGTETAVTTASREIVRPVVTQILGLIYSIVIMVVLLVVVKFLAKMINRVFSFSIIGKANRLLGGIIGIPKGIIFAILFCMVISLIVSLNNGFLIFTAENIEKTYVFKFFAEIIPL